MRNLDYKKRKFRRTGEQIDKDIQEQMKTCPECRVRQPFSEYQKNGHLRDGLHNLCKTCTAAQTKEYRKKPSVQRTKKNTNLRHLYGITLEEKEALLESQGGVCAICKTDHPGTRNKEFYLDHCHETNDIRGVLCHRCNTGLGHFKDNENLLLSALRYLNASRNRHRSENGSEPDPHREDN